MAETREIGEVVRGRSDAQRREPPPTIPTLSPAGVAVLLLLLGAVFWHSRRARTWQTR